MGTVDRIVTAMTELMRRRGYSATGVAELARAAGVPNGSIYHHFPGGKRDVAAVALQEMGTAYGQLMTAVLDEYEDLAVGVEALFAEAARVMDETGWVTMCPVVTVAAETADLEPELREIGAKVISGWVEDGAAYLHRRGLSANDARAVAQALFATIEGAFLTARVLRSREPFHSAGRLLAAWVATRETVDRLLRPSEAP